MVVTFCQWSRQVTTAYVGDNLMASFGSLFDKPPSSSAPSCIISIRENKSPLAFRKRKLSSASAANLATIPVHYHPTLYEGEGVGTLRLGATVLSRRDIQFMSSGISLYNLKLSAFQIFTFLCGCPVSLSLSLCLCVCVCACL